MEDMLTRIWENLGDRITGPMHFRVYLQPVMAMIFAVLDGLKDARTGKPPYFWSLLSNPEHRADMVKSGWKSVGKVFLLAVVLDAVYQFIVQKSVYPGEVILVAIILAILPYVIVRGLVTRLVPKKQAGQGKR
jgi:hypothetical protein